MKLWLSVAEGAEYAGVCRDLIYDACAARRIHHIRVGGRRATRLKREWIDAWLERHTVDAQDGPLCSRSGRRERSDGGHVMTATLTTPRSRGHLTTEGGREHGVSRRGLPLFLNVVEAAELLRTTRRAIYPMSERRQLPGVVRLRRRVLFRADDLLDWRDPERAPSPGE
jgi:excisionase family DNA binding protein